MTSYLVFQPAFKYFKTSSGTSNQIVAWKSSEFSEESVLLHQITLFDPEMVPKLKQNLMEVSETRKNNFSLWKHKSDNTL